MVKNPPTVQEMQLRSLGREDPLEKEMANHSSIHARRILGQATVHGVEKELDVPDRPMLFTVKTYEPFRHGRLGATFPCA